jgi:regulatory protein
MGRRRQRPSRARRRPEITLDAKGARTAAADLLSRKAWSRQELTRRLERRGAPPDVAAAVVADLAGRGYLDDEALAQHVAEARARARGIGSRRLTLELGRRGIAKDTAARAVTRAFEETGELELALQAGRRRLAALRRGPSDRLAGRLGDHLLRRGYPPAVVRRVVRALLPGAAAALEEPGDV